MSDAFSQPRERGAMGHQGALGANTAGDSLPRSNGSSNGSSNGLNYRIRVSKRAKNINIHVSHWGDVEIVIPPSVDPRQVPEIVERRREWIVRTRQRFLDRQETMPLDVVQPLPEEIQLRSLPETWTVIYAPAPGTHLTATTRSPCQLHVHGPTENLESCQSLLRRWLNRKATYHFLPWLRQVSREIDLPYTSASVRQQKTRWASCSSKRTISLNAKLLFLPAPLVRYVFIHELCHTVHMNHSAQFWALVGKKEPDYERLDRELQKAWCYVPAWVERSRPSSAAQ
ncbi:M48 family metallopeptidase [Thermoleptolyngbya sp. M55_K2018_002]|uniref:M48 family metallopeptidase n=1 Tax=Thermoleptolyngbya sp. M55_K2018_002 TaxID=2747808 RepID=UPI0025D634C5|nr:SprT family zinc-dependent metalloprotease [Thermoleptolyngbya sp. M55_K2018_002]